MWKDCSLTVVSVVVRGRVPKGPPTSDVPPASQGFDEGGSGDYVPIDDLGSSGPTHCRLLRKDLR